MARPGAGQARFHVAKLSSLFHPPQAFFPPHIVSLGGQATHGDGAPAPPRATYPVKLLKAPLLS